jgi:Xaa-Pro aminopeptidase
MPIASQALREQLKRDRLDGFVVPLTDEHMSEYVGAYAQRLAWLTGFQGSAGIAVVLPQRGRDLHRRALHAAGAPAGLGRRLGICRRARHQHHAGWAQHAPDGGRIGYDPWLHTRAWVEEARKALAEKGAELVAVDTNPVDRSGPTSPRPSDATLSVQDDAAAGKSSAAKRAEIADWLAERKADAVVLSALDSIAWAFNIRGNDVSHTPVALAYAIVNADGTADLFVAPEKITDAVRQHLGNAIRIHDRAAFAPALRTFQGKRVAADPERAVAAIFDSLDAGGARILSLRDPVVLAKALKNPAEIAGHKAAQARDGAALVRFLKWFEETAPLGGLTEMSAADKLRAFRDETGVLKDLSFDTISATGPNGAIPHYKVTDESSLPIELGPALSRRFGRPICRRHHRRDPGDAGRRSHARDEGPLHPRAQGPYRHRHRALPRRHHRRPARQLRAARRSGKSGSITATAPATASAPISRCTRGRSASPSPSIPAARRSSRCAPACSSRTSPVTIRPANSASASRISC